MRRYSEAFKADLGRRMSPAHRHSVPMISQELGTFLAGFGEVGFDEVDQRLPRVHFLHLREKLPLIGLLLGGGELVI